MGVKTVYFVHPVSENKGNLSMESILSIVSMLFAPKLHREWMFQRAHSSLKLQIERLYLSIRKGDLLNLSNSSRDRFRLP